MPRVQGATMEPSLESRRKSWSQESWLRSSKRMKALNSDLCLLVKKKARFGEGSGEMELDAWFAVMGAKWVIIVIMLFGKLLENVNEAEENDLFEMEQELRQGIDRAKNMAASCKMGPDEDQAFQTNEAGVFPSRFRSWSTPNSKTTSTTTKNSGRPTSRMSWVFPSSRTCRTRLPSSKEKSKS